MAYTGAKAKAAVLTAVRAAVAADPRGAQVTYGHPGQHAEDDVVIVGDVTTERTEPRMGARTADEVHAVRVTISCARTNGDQQECTERAVALFDLIDAYLRAVPAQDLGAGADGIYLGHIVGAVELAETPDDDEQLAEGRSAALTFAVQAKSRRT